MVLLMMNSSRARPTPSFGMKDRANASSGFATFIMMRVRGRLSPDRLTRSTSKARVPSYTNPVSPSAQETVTICPVANAAVPVSVPTMAGTPSSRLTIAA